MNSPARGFTLIELLVVIAIIGLLSAIVLASLNTARTRGQDAARESDVKSLETAMELYYNDNGGYPTSNGSGNGDVLLSDATLVGKLVPKYIASMPALLIADGDHYYGAGATSGVETTGYDMYIYVGASNSYCRAGTLPTWTGDWGTPTVCNF
ncbi:MAG: prepilin-type N-terminal cleavage/methylation domain-containing protein [Patescibacteria group bacterium]|nr:prepilin-type N-terminal cleavage/methylation domain-containing protein [Patescibacteria group bacterium]MDE1944328.1 prepilin-type N-terminal cleavage/methylation domain-containing protein [Patescibacteria group bacterium]MDE1944672.1 prepilin-type N-terminal cleavage/methylation domain-containing protein [Patescibacteria group bacterium]MDE2057358.1 prepilin-type N-terminal cleavage/methylation domain-containing protein [Patescibacteria group bacterium]